MAVLAGKQITRLVDEHKLKIKPFYKKQIQPATYDLRLGKRILASPLGPEKLGEVVDLSKMRPSYDIQSGQMVGIISHERLELPLDICGRFGVRSSYARFGINAFGGLQLDPGFKGKLIMNLLNVGPEPITLTIKEPIFSVEFDRLEEPAEGPYSGPYQDQDDFPDDQYNFILHARTTSLAEIPTLRMEVAHLSNVIEELEESLPDADAGLEIRPEIIERLQKSSALPRRTLVSIEKIRKQLGINA